MDGKQNTKKSALFVLGAGMLWGCMGILVRTMNRGGFNSLEVTAFRSLVTTVFMFGGMFLFNRKELKIRLRDLWCFLGSGVLSVTFFNVCYFTCMNYATLSVAAILLYTAPSFMILMAAVLFRERITVGKVAALVLAFAGCVLVSGGFTGRNLTGMTILTGLGAGFGYALYSVFGKYAIQKGYSSYTITTYTFLFAGLGTLPFLNGAHVLQCISDSKVGDLAFAVFLTVLTTTVAYLLYTAGLKGLESGRASIIASIEPVTASLIGWLLYKEEMRPEGIAGMLLVLASCALVAGKGGKEA